MAGKMKPMPKGMPPKGMPMRPMPKGMPKPMPMKAGKKGKR